MIVIISPLKQEQVSCSKHNLMDLDLANLELGNIFAPNRLNQH